jgi:hypothetical protein
MTLKDMLEFFRKKQEEAADDESPVTKEERTEIWRKAAEKAREYSAEKSVAADERAKRAEEYARKVEAYSKEQLAMMQTLFCKSVAERAVRIAELESEVARLTMPANVEMTGAQQLAATPPSDAGCPSRLSC